MYSQSRSDKLIQSSKFSIYYVTEIMTSYFRKMAERKKRKLSDSEKEPQKGLTHGSGIHRTLDIDEDFEREVQAERGLSALKSGAEKKLDKRLIVVLENANLELG